MIAPSAAPQAPGAKKNPPRPPGRERGGVDSPFGYFFLAFFLALAFGFAFAAGLALAGAEAPQDFFM